MRRPSMILIGSFKCPTCLFSEEYSFVFMVAVTMLDENEIARQIISGGNGFHEERGRKVREAEVGKEGMESRYDWTSIRLPPPSPQKIHNK